MRLKLFIKPTALTKSFVTITSVLLLCLKAGSAQEEASFTPPVLIEESEINFPLKLLKTGVGGEVRVELDIDKNGRVTDCRLVESLHPAIDSSLCKAAEQSRFSPAVENGMPTEATVVLETVFNIDSIALSGGSVEPDIQGTVLRREDQTPVEGAHVSLTLYENSAEDPDLAISLSKYLETIGKTPGQSYREGKLVTRTDPEGKFSFRLLPNSVAKLAIETPKFGTTQFPVYCDSKTKTDAVYLLGERYPDVVELMDSSYEVTAFGYEPIKEDVTIAKQEQKTGLTHFVSQIALSQAPIRQIPEAGSSMLVRSAGPFDNRFFVAGVPMLAPSHFAGHIYADIDGAMIANVKEVKVITDRLGGRFTDASGAVIRIDPDVFLTADSDGGRRSELSVDYSSIGQDFSLTIPLQKEDLLQFGLTRGETWTLLASSYTLERANVRYNPCFTPPVPISYGNVTAAGIFSAKDFRVAPFFWLAYDSYMEDRLPVTPWGLASVRFGSRDDSLSGVAGYSRQYYMQSKPNGRHINQNLTYINSGYLSVKSPIDMGRIARMKLEGSLEGLDWTGHIIRDSLDTTKYQYSRDAVVTDTLRKQNGRELNAQLKAYIEKDIGKIKLGLDLLGSGAFTRSERDLFTDAGISGEWEKGNLFTRINFGRITSHPDVRGMPSPALRRKQSVSYNASVGLSYGKGGYSIRVQPYTRIQFDVPRINPHDYTWKQNGMTDLQAYGADISGEYFVSNWLSLIGALNLAQSHRDSSGVKLPYEWHVPWTVRSSVVFSVKKKAKFRLDGVFSEGLPYFDLANSGAIKRVPNNYSRVDFCFEYQTGKIEHRYLSTRYDVFLRLVNLLDHDNIRDYYWNTGGTPVPILLKGLNFEFGAKAYFRLW